MGLALCGCIPQEGGQGVLPQSIYFNLGKLAVLKFYGHHHLIMPAKQ